MTPASATTQVARLTDTDWRLFSTVRLRALSDSFGTDDPQYRREAEFTAAQWRRRLRDHAQFVALADGQPVGLIGAQHENLETVYLYSLWLDPTARGLGLARSLIAAAAQWARERGAGTARLRVAAENTAARTVYASLGFTIAGTEASTPSGELAMTLTLS